jgi:hypothetical protein
LHCQESIIQDAESLRLDEEEIRMFVARHQFDADNEIGGDALGHKAANK